jgi:hypothetical protein
MSNRPDLHFIVVTLGLAIACVPLGGCKETEDAVDDVDRTIDEAVESEVTGRVLDDQGEPVVGVRVRLYDLLDNTDFVEGHDIGSLEAYIDKQAVLESDNDLAEATTDDDGDFLIEAPPGAFLAVASHVACSAGFAGFDEETGVLDLGTLITPTFDNGLRFSIPTFVLACATPPEVGEDGNTEECPPFEPELPEVTCDAASCSEAGGTCQEDACIFTCAVATCTESGGSCIDGECIQPPSCDEAQCAEAGGSCEGDECVMPTCAEACEAARGVCSDDGTTCEIPECFAAEAECIAAGGACSSDGVSCQVPACNTDADCQAAQPGAYCVNPGDLELAACAPPVPEEIVPPAEPLGWTSLRITDSEDELLADASEANQRVETDDIPEDGVVRVYGDFDGDETRAYIHVQSGGQRCPSLPPRTDFVPVEIVDGHLASERGAFVELVLHRGCQKVQLSTSDVLGEGERSFLVEIGDACAPPAAPFTAILTWDAGPGQPADLDLNVWNGADDHLFFGKKQAAWGRLAHEGKGPGPEVFEASDASEGPFIVKVQFFSGRPRDVAGKVRILRTVDGQRRDETFAFTVKRPKDIVSIGVFEAE